MESDFQNNIILPFDVHYTHKQTDIRKIIIFINMYYRSPVRNCCDFEFKCIYLYGKIDMQCVRVRMCAWMKIRDLHSYRKHLLAQQRTPSALLCVRACVCVVVGIAITIIIVAACNRAYNMNIFIQYGMSIDSTELFCCWYERWTMTVKRK